MLGIGKKKVFTPAKLQGTSTGFWIDAADYPVGAIANGATITNKFNAAQNFTVVGTGLSVAINSRGRKAFVFDGNVVLQNTDKVYCRHLHNYSNKTIIFIGKVGAVADPNTFYGLMGSNAGSSTNIGFAIAYDDRATINEAGQAYPANGGIPRNNSLVYQMARAVANQWVFNTFTNNTISANTPGTMIVQHVNGVMAVDACRLYTNRYLLNIFDRQRSTANTTSALGSPYGASTTDATYNFEIGSYGNNVGRLVGEIESVIITTAAATQRELQMIASYYNITPVRANARLIEPVVTERRVSGTYVLGGTLDKNPVNGKTAFVSSGGLTHFAANNDREGLLSVSTDDGYNYPAFSTIWANPSKAVHGDVVGGYTTEGKLVVAYTQYASSGTVTYDPLQIQTSDDDGQTWTLQTLEKPAGLNVILPRGKMIKLTNGDYIIPLYGGTTTGDILYEIWLLRSTDNGNTWSIANRVYTSTTEYINECAIVELSANNLYLIARKEVAISGNFGFTAFSSSDNGVSWTRQNNLTLDTNAVYAHPPQLEDITINGVRVIALYWQNRDSRRFRVCYTRASDLQSSPATAWTGKTVYIIDIQANTTYVSGYPVIYQPGTLEGYGVIFDEAANFQTTTQIFFRLPVEHRQQIISELGL